MFLLRVSQFYVKNDTDSVVSIYNMKYTWSILACIIFFEKNPNMHCFIQFFFFLIFKHATSRLNKQISYGSNLYISWFFLIHKIL